MKLHRVLASALVLSITAVSLAAAADDGGNATLTNAQGLYAQAAYEQALALLDRLDPKASASLEEGQAIRRYRALCLIALGRHADAESAIDEMVRADPAAGVDEDLPPRLQDLVKEIRARVVRDIVRQGYERGRDLYGREEYTAASAEFERVIALLDDRALSLTKEASFADVRLLADGFLRLSKAAAAPAPAAAEPTASRPAPKPAVLDDTRSSGAAFVAPVPILQDVPPFPRSAGAGFMARNEGDLDVDVGADGRVTSARVVSSIHPVYDLILAAAAKTWKYQPARRYGEPVAYTKRVHIILQPK